MELLQACLAISSIFAVLGGLVAFAVVRPINDSIRRIEDVLKEIRTDLKSNVERFHELEGKVLELQHSAQKAHDRIDAFLKEQAHHVKPN